MTSLSEQQFTKEPQPAKRTALVAGATGLVGGHCVEELLQEDSYSRVVALVRRPGLPVREKLEEYLIDFESLDDETRLPAVDDVFCCLGTTIKKAGTKEAFRRVDHDYVVFLARAALASGAKQFLLVSSIGANAESRIFYSSVKGDIEADISALPFRAVQIFRPSVLLGNRNEFRLGEKLAQIVSRALAFLFVGGLSKYRPIEAKTVARAMVKVARREPEGVHVYESDAI
jgi:uncharacterized protein YbjT (DUF2867 family)